MYCRNRPDAIRELLEQRREELLRPFKKAEDAADENLKRYLKKFGQVHDPRWNATDEELAEYNRKLRSGKLASVNGKLYLMSAPAYEKAVAMVALEKEATSKREDEEQRLSTLFRQFSIKTLLNRDYENIVEEIQKLS